MQQRREKIINLVDQQGRLSVAELAKQTGVSVVTIRQDLNQLERLGYLKRIHGYAVSVNSDDIQTRMSIHFDLKRRLAERAVEMIADGETIFIEGGSANALLARTLAERRQVTIITVSSYIAHLLRDTGIPIMLLGGLYQPQSESVVGPLTRLCIQHVHFSKAFIGIDGFRPDTGFTGRDMMRADVVNEVLAKGVTNIVVTDSSKFGVIHPAPLGRITDFSVVLTDTGIGPDDEASLVKQGLQVIKVDA